jgi:hypothetical protein
MAALVAVAAVALSTVHGIVLRGPTKPVCSMPEPCSEPAKGAVLAFVRSGHIARVRVDANGRYRVSLVPGTYAVRVTPPAGIGRGIEPRTVVVGRRDVRRDFMIDTGIR